MLLQNPMRVQTACPRRWSLAAAGALFGAAVLFSGLGLRADPAFDPDVVEPSRTRSDPKGNRCDPGGSPVQIH